jgi:hypothetical protein
MNGTALLAEENYIIPMLPETILPSDFWLVQYLCEIDRRAIKGIYFVRKLGRSNAYKLTKITLLM